MYHSKITNLNYFNCNTKNACYKKWYYVI